MLKTGILLPTSGVPIKAKKVSLLQSDFNDRFNVNREYVVSLKNDNLLQNYYIEAGLKSWSSKPEGIHWGWESPECQLRGHFLGHWLSAASKIFDQTGDDEIKGKADRIISELYRCQKENGGKWAGSIPQKYFDWIASGKRVWAPHYTVHKTFMGLVDMYKYSQNSKSLDIADRWADWFHEWSGNYTRQQMDDILDFETGGMLEIWADLYGITGKQKYIELMERYDRPRLFEKLLANEDPLTNKHANTTIPEIHGAARAWEVTQDSRYRKIVEAYWNQSVLERGYFCTGGQTNAEVWSPKHTLGTRLSPTNQEHCVVYNMIRLADYLFRWTGDVNYLDYIERNIYNGIFAQQNPYTGMVIYYMPLHANSVKKWGSPTEHFWCCHGTLVQAHTMYAEIACYESVDELFISQYIPATFKWIKNGVEIEIKLNLLPKWIDTHDCKDNKIHVEIKTSQPIEFSVNFRIPWWVDNAPDFRINDESYNTDFKKISDFVTIKRYWRNDNITITLDKKVYTVSLPDIPDMVAFMYGPTVLAGLCEEERTIYTGGKPPGQLLRPFNVSKWDKESFYTTEQPINIKFIPLHDVINERYTIYFPVK